MYIHVHCVRSVHVYHFSAEVCVCVCVFNHASVYRHYPRPKSVYSFFSSEFFHNVNKEQFILQRRAAVKTFQRHLVKFFQHLGSEDL